MRMRMGMGVVALLLAGVLPAAAATIRGVVSDVSGAPVASTRGRA